MKTISVKKSLAIGAVATIIYLLISFYLVNYHIFLETLTGNYTLLYKTRLISSLLIGSIQILPGYEVMLIGVTAVLVGINAAFITKLIRKIRNQGRLSITTGGTSLLAVAGAGCPSCGVSVLSVLGISSSALPLRGVTLQLVTIGLLGASLIYNYKKLHQPLTCPTK